MTDYFHVNDTVDYHAIIGGKVTSTGHVVRAVRLSPNNFGRPVAWITGRVDCVAMDALTKSAGGKA